MTETTKPKTDDKTTTEAPLPHVTGGWREGETVLKHSNGTTYRYVRVDVPDEKLWNTMYTLQPIAVDGNDNGEPIDVEYQEIKAQGYTVDGANDADNAAWDAIAPQLRDGVDAMTDEERAAWQKSALEKGFRIEERLKELQAENERLQAKLTEALEQGGDDALEVKQQRKRIDDLEQSNESKDRRISQLEGEIAKLKATNQTQSKLIKDVLPANTIQTKRLIQPFDPQKPEVIDKDDQELSRWLSMNWRIASEEYKSVGGKDYHIVRLNCARPVPKITDFASAVQDDKSSADDAKLAGRTAVFNTGVDTFANTRPATRPNTIQLEASNGE